jgi:hypothetical protein
MKRSERYRKVVMPLLLAVSLLLFASEERAVAGIVESYRYEAVPKGSDGTDSREAIDMHIVTSADRVEYAGRVVIRGETEEVRAVTDGQGRVVFASKQSLNGSEVRITKIWRDGEKVYVGEAGGDGGKAKTIEMPKNLPLAVDASLLILLRSFPFDTGQEWEVFMVDFSGFSTTVTVRQALTETVATPAGAFECYRIEVVVGIPILRPKITYWLTRDAPHFLVSHQGKRGPFTSSYVTSLIAIDSAVRGAAAP